MKKERSYKQKRADLKNRIRGLMSRVNQVCQISEELTEHEMDALLTCAGIMERVLSAWGEEVAENVKPEKAHSKTLKIKQSEMLEMTKKIQQRTKNYAAISIGAIVYSTGDSNLLYRLDNGADTFSGVIGFNSWSELLEKYKELINE